MFNRDINSERDKMTGRFISVEKPSPAEGIGRALQFAFRDNRAMPLEICDYIDRLDLIRI